MTKLKLHKLGDDRFRNASFLIFGEPKVGKTSLIRTARPILKDQSYERAFIVDADNGLNSIGDLKDITVVRPFVDATPMEILDYLKTDGQGKYDLVKVDGLDRIGQEVFNRISDAENKKAKPDGFKIWRDFGDAMRRWVLGMTNLEGMSKVFITHTKEDAESDIRYHPDFPGGKVGTELFGYFDYIFYMGMFRLEEGKPTERAFITTRDVKLKGDPRYEVGARVPMDREPLPGKMKADLSLVWDKLFGEAK